MNTTITYSTTHFHPSLIFVSFETERGAMVVIPRWLKNRLEQGTLTEGEVSVQLTP